mmetsp:Transcript_7077/g.19308  ORF Transcript_7077/g.19308 Transcript_7077/m.19308 type:complete len:235 (+) Transcript_7077:263-967(+)
MTPFMSICSPLPCFSDVLERSRPTTPTSPSRSTASPVPSSSKNTLLRLTLAGMSSGISPGRLAPAEDPWPGILSRVHVLCLVEPFRDWSPTFLGVGVLGLGFAAGPSSSSSSSSSSRRRHRTSLLMRFRSSTTPRARPRSVGVVATGDVPAFSAASSDVTFTTRRSRRSSPGRTPCRTRAIPSVDAASAPCSTPNAGGDVTIAIIAARRTTATAGSRGRAPRLSRSNIIGDPPP